jgi:hypothetical protein
MKRRCRGYQEDPLLVHERMPPSRQGGDNDHGNSNSGSKARKKASRMGDELKKFKSTQRMWWPPRMEQKGD